jgi:zinc transporter ZupT
MEFLPKSRTVAHQYNVYGMIVVSATVLLMAMAEVLMRRQLARLGRLQEELTSRLKQERTSNEPAFGCKGTQLAEEFIFSHGCKPESSPAVQFQVASPTQSSRGQRNPRLPLNDGEVMAVMQVTEHGNLRHLRQLARKIRDMKLDDSEPELDAICRLTSHSIGQSDVPIDSNDFHALLMELIGTSRVRSDLIWHQLCRRNRGDWPTMADLAAVLKDLAGRGKTMEDNAFEDPMDYEVPKFMGWVLEAADRFFGCGRVVAQMTDQTDSCDSSTPHTSTTRDVTNAISAVSNFQSRRAQLAHLESAILRVTPAFEAVLIIVGAGVLHLIAGLSVGLVAAADFHTGAVFAILFAVQHFPEGLLLSGDTAGSGLYKTSRCRWFFATAVVGLCDCLGAGIAFAVTAARGVLPNEVLAAIYFVIGGIFVQLALRKYLRAAVSFDSEKEIPTIAMVAGMMITGAVLLSI